MTVRELIRDLLNEVGKHARADQLFKELSENERANMSIGADVDSGPIRYIESIADEFPSHMALETEKQGIAPRIIYPIDPRDIDFSEFDEEGLGGY